MVAAAGDASFLRDQDNTPLLARYYTAPRTRITQVVPVEPAPCSGSLKSAGGHPVVQAEDGARISRSACIVSQIELARVVLKVIEDGRIDGLQLRMGMMRHHRRDKSSEDACSHSSNRKNASHLMDPTSSIHCSRTTSGCNCSSKRARAVLDILRHRSPSFNFWTASAISPGDLLGMRRPSLPSSITSGMPL